MINLKTKLVIAVIVLLALVTAAVTDSFIYTIQLFQSGQLLAHTQEVRTELEAIFAAMNEVESAQRGYIVLQDKELLALMRTSKDDALRGIARVRKLVSDNPTQQKNCDSLLPLVQTKIRFAEECIRLRQSEGEASATALVQTKTGIELSDRIEHQIRRMLALEQLLLTDRLKSSFEAKDRTIYTLFALAFLSLALIGTIVYLANRYLYKRELAISTEASYRHVFENASDLILVVAVDGSIVVVNNAWKKTFGRDVHDLHGLRIWDLVHPSCIASVKQVFVDAGSGKRQSERFEAQLLVSDGSIIHVEGIVSVNADPKYEDSSICIFRDITQRKEMEQRIVEFYSMVSHELRSPLASIRGALGLIEGGLAGPISDRANNLVKIANCSCDRLIRLVNDILDLRKIEAGKMELAISELLPEEVINVALDSLSSIIEDSAITISLYIEPDTTFWGDSDKVAQVLNNLLSNAVKFSPRGAVIQIRSERLSDGTVKISIIDEGPGIPEEQQSKLFGMFQQVDSSDRRPKEGSGLGLAISKNIIELMGGTIGFESNVGKGSTFWFCLPSSDQFPKSALCQTENIGLVSPVS